MKRFPTADNKSKSPQIPPNIDATQHCNPLDIVILSEAKDLRALANSPGAQEPLQHCHAGLASRLAADFQSPTGGQEIIPRSKQTVIAGT